MITVFDGDNTRDVREDVKKALAEVGRKHGIVIRLQGNSWRYSTTRMGLTVEALTQERASAPPAPPAFSPVGQQDVGNWYRLDNATYELVGFRPARRKGNSCKIERIPDRKPFVCRPSMLTEKVEKKS
jgi:hypothetical protein